MSALPSFEIRAMSNRILTIKKADFDQETISVGDDFEGMCDSNQHVRKVT